VDWERLYSQQPPYTPVVTHELDTRNFENFEVPPLLPELAVAVVPAGCGRCNCTDLLSGCVPHLQAAGSITAMDMLVSSWS
jgi:hypothetical protein